MTIYIGRNQVEIRSLATLVCFVTIWCKQFQGLSPSKRNGRGFTTNLAGVTKRRSQVDIFLVVTSPGRTYARVGVRDPARMYVCGRIYFLAPRPMYIRVHAMCAPLHRPVCTYTFATRMTTLRTLRRGGSRLSGTSLAAKM